MEMIHVMVLFWISAGAAPYCEENLFPISPRQPKLLEESGKQSIRYESRAGRDGKTLKYAW